MKKFLIFIAGLIIGGVLVWSYYVAIALPRLRATIETAAKEQLSAERHDQEMTLLVTVNDIEGTTIHGTTERTGAPESVSIIVGADTELFTFASDDASTKVDILLEQLSAGSVITVVTAGEIETSQPIYAKTITKI